MQHGVEVAIETGAKIIIAVLGSYADLLRKEITNKEVEVIINGGWKEGMASSIRYGIKKLLEIEPGAEAVIIMVCDQPFVTVKLLNDLVEKYVETRKPIIASSYENSMGTPALFDRSMFAALQKLEGDVGAKRIMKENPGLLGVVNFPLGNIDIDTDSDYEALMKSNE